MNQKKMVPAYLSSDSLLQATAAAKTNQLTAICPSEVVHIQASRCQLLVSASNRTSRCRRRIWIFFEILNKICWS